MVQVVLVSRISSWLLMRGEQQILMQTLLVMELSMSLTSLLS